MNFKQFSASDNQWHDVPYYIHKTDTDTITTLPAVIYANDTTATVGLKGNMSQASGVSPTNPIQPQECGERTGNLFDANTIEVGGIDIRTGEELVNDSRRRSGFIEVTPSTAYYISRLIDESNPSILWVIGYDSSKQVITDGSGTYHSVVVNGQLGLNVSSRQFTTTATTKYIRWYVTANGSYSDIMLNAGSAALPYEPYGIKIPISSANTTTPIYLGEVQTTRKIKKLVLTGTENWVHRSGNPPNAFFLGINTINVVNHLAISTHYINQDSGSFDDLQDGHILVRLASSGDKTYIGLRDSNYPATPKGRDQLKEWLAQQYANGTPVTVWYVLAEPTTGIVNEPLRKIGDYADTVSGITIPTITGANTISIGTTLQPSEVTVNYKGWHPVQSVHEAENGQWD